MENHHTWFKWPMHLIPRVCSNLLCASVGWGIFHIRTCQIVSCNFHSQSVAMACETFWHLVMSDFTYGCTWWWCAGSWGAAACTRGFASHGRQTWRMGLYSPCTPSPGIGRISPCCPVRKIRNMWLTWQQRSYTLRWITCAACPDMHWLKKRKMQCCSEHINQINNVFACNNIQK